jgi:hypothetical protein
MIGLIFLFFSNLGGCLVLLRQSCRFIVFSVIAAKPFSLARCKVLSNTITPLRWL